MMSVFKKANILIPKNIDMKKWTVIACDQYTSLREYWKEVSGIVGDEPTTLNLIVPEVYLEEEDIADRIEEVNIKMEEYLNSELFDTVEDALIYVERTQANGRVRKGIVGMVDLECYSYELGSQSPIRATEGTILERIPPRVMVRENASLELPHVMLLIDDEKNEIIDRLGDLVKDDQIVYDFDLMQNGGHIKGYRLADEQMSLIFEGLSLLSNKEMFNKKYAVHGKETLLFAVGDGNHSLATAKTCYENLKKKLSKDEYENHPSRYALVEVVNLHDKALEFEPIHRVLFGVDPIDVINELKKYYEITLDGNGQKIEYMYKGKEGSFVIKNPKSNLAVGSLQMFLDEYLKKRVGKIDYIHEEDVVRKLAGQDGNIGFLLPAMGKNDLFKTVILDGSLPRKTFSMGHSDDKRFYLEARKIK